MTVLGIGFPLTQACSDDRENEISQEVSARLRLM